jgi:ribosome-associated toxin RatA of RatAB toxin-antitoxin module
MRHMGVSATVNGHTASEVYLLLCDMARYPKYSPVVLGLTVTPSGDESPDSSVSSSVSKWKVRFGEDEAGWTQRDDFDPANHTIRFTRLSGDIENFTGSWVLSSLASDCTVQFAADFDIGVPGLDEIIEPMVETMLRENITAILTGLFGDRVSIEA